MSERERLANAVLKAVENTSLGWTRVDSEQGAVGIDGELDAFAIANALISAGFGDKAEAWDEGWIGREDHAMSLRSFMCFRTIRNPYREENKPKKGNK